MLSNLSTQFRPAQTRNTEYLPLPAPRADRTRADDSEQILPPPIAHHTVYENIRNLQRNPCLSVGNTFVPVVGPLSRLVDRPHFELLLSKGVLELQMAQMAPFHWRRHSTVLYFIFVTDNIMEYNKQKTGIPTISPPPSNRATCCSSGVVITPPPLSTPNQCVSQLHPQNIYLFFLRKKILASHRAQGGTPTVSLSLGANREGKERVKGKASRIHSS